MKSKEQKERLLATGAGGRLGHLIGAMLKTGGETILTVRHPPGDLILDGAGSLPELPRCGAVLALWGSTSNEPALAEANVTLAHRSRAVAAACGARLVLHLSSAAVYGPGRDLRETDTPCPVAVYGQSKLRMERDIASFGEDHARHVCLRLANVVGADSLAPALRGDRPLLLDRFADGAGPRRSYLAPGDLVRVVRALVGLDPETLPAVINLAAPRPVSMEALARAAGRDVTWTPAREEALQEVSLATDRLQGLLPGLRLHRTASEMIADWRMLRSGR